jgi:phosphoribosyl-ATP pyrophosphohydrolase
MGILGRGALLLRRGGGGKRMNYIFPETKFVRENTPERQLDHVMSEAIELQDELMEDATEKIREEAMDLYHSLETLFRIWERQGVDMEAVRQKVFEKNRERGYYLGEEKTEGDK